MFQSVAGLLDCACIDLVALAERRRDDRLSIGGLQMTERSFKAGRTKGRRMPEVGGALARVAMPGLPATLRSHADDLRIGQLTPVAGFSRL